MRASLDRWLALLRKEFLTLIKERAARAILIGPLLIQTFLFGYAANFDLRDIPVAVVLQSSGQYSQALAAAIDQSSTFHVSEVLASTSQMDQALGASGALAVVVIPSDFDENLWQGNSSAVGIFLDGTNSTTANLAAAELGQLLESFNAQALGRQATMTFEQRAWFNPNMLTQWNLVTALIATLAFIQVMILTSLSISREREQGTFDQLLVTPYTQTQILLAKATPPVAIGLLQSTAVLLIAVFWFDIPFRGALPLLYLGLLAFTLATVGIGLTVSAISRTMQQSMIGSFVLIVPMTLLSGLLTPVDNMPRLLQWFAQINPLTHALEIVHQVFLQNSRLELVATQILPLAATALITLILAARFFRRNL